jgi:hypothetical protein
MPIDFPTSPTTGQVYTYLGKSWVYNGTAWDAPKALSEIGAVQTFANAAARTAAIPTPTEGIVSYLNDTNLLQTNNGSAWVTTGNAGVNAYNFVQTLYYTSSGTFTKATYPWLRAIKVKVVGGGGGGAGCGTTGASQMTVGGAGGGGATAESFITDIASLASSVTVTRGAGGAGGVGNNNGNAGGESSFGNGLAYEVSAQGGNFGSAFPAGAAPNTTGASGSNQTTGVGQLVIAGSGGIPRTVVNSATNIVWRSSGGNSTLGFGGEGSSTSSGGVGASGDGYGAGGAGGANSDSQGTARNGGAGSNGIVIIELYA